MSSFRPLLALLAFGVVPSAFAQQVQLPLPPAIPLTPSLNLPLPPIGLPQIGPLPVIPVGPRLQGTIPVKIRESGVLIHYDTQSPYPVRYEIVGIVGSP